MLNVICGLDEIIENVRPNFVINEILQPSLFQFQRSSTVC